MVAGRNKVVWASLHCDSTGLKQAPLEIPPLGHGEGTSSPNTILDKGSFCITWGDLNEHLQATLGILYKNSWPRPVLNPKDSRKQTFRECEKLYRKETSIVWSFTGILFLFIKHAFLLNAIPFQNPTLSTPFYLNPKYTFLKCTSQKTKPRQYTSQITQSNYRMFSFSILP